ncbi:MAG: phage tail tube protein [Acidobacteriota bacterium]
MGLIRTNANNQVVCWGETVCGTRPAPVLKGQRLGLIGHNLGRTQAPGRSRVLRGDPNLSRVPRGRFKFEGRRLSLAIERNMIGIPLYKFFPSYAVAGVADPYTHTLKLVGGAFHAAGPYLGWEIWDTDAAKGEVVDGTVIAGIEGEINTEDTEAGLSFDVVGIAKGNFGTSSREDATPDEYTDAYFNMADAQIKVNGAVSDYVARGTFAFKRAVSVRAIPDSNRYAKHIILGRIADPTITLVGLHDDTAAVEALATGEAEHQVEFIFKHPSNANHSLSFLFPEIAFFKQERPEINEGANEQEVTVVGTPYYQDGANLTSCVVTLKNPLATYVGLVQ